MKTRKEGLKAWILENSSYKIVALLVTLILWVTILGRRDFVVTKEMDVEFLLPKNVNLETVKSEKKVLVKVSGPRTALRRFGQTPGSITLDLTQASVKTGKNQFKARFEAKNIEIPFGVKIVSIEPESMDVVLSPVGSETQVNPEAGVRGDKAVKPSTGIQ